MQPEEQRSGQQRYTIIPRTLVFLTRDKMLLLLKGAPDKRLWAGQYNGLGGHIKAGESPYRAAVREVQEEAGLEVDNLTLRAIIHITMPDPPGITAPPGISDPLSMPEPPRMPAPPPTLAPVERTVPVSNETPASPAEASRVEEPAQGSSGPENPAGVDAPEEPEKDPDTSSSEKPWAWTILGLAASIGLNFFLAWTLADFRARHRAVLRRLGESPVA